MVGLMGGATLTETDRALFLSEQASERRYIYIYTHLTVYPFFFPVCLEKEQTRHAYDTDIERRISY